MWMPCGELRIMICPIAIGQARSVFAALNG
jgi:hypothetical protein